MTQLSVVLAVHNEEQQLPACLEATQGLADEIVIVDGESSDQTVSIAQRFGAKVISTTNKSNFHINKQMAIDAATNELILQLDADEVIDEELRSFIHKLKQIPVPTDLTLPVAWYIPRKNFLFGRWLSKGGQYPDMVIRLFYGGKAALPQQNVHEQMQVQGVTGVASGHLLHTAYPTFDAYMIKFNRYTSFEAERLLPTHPDRLSIFRYWLSKPLMTFFSLYLRHRGYVDGMAGFVFALMSALHHPFVWLKHQEIMYAHTH